jgi:formylglycine-generating enzyme required for sulfatase activity
MVAIPGGKYLMGRDVTEDEKLLEVSRAGGRDRVFTYDYPAHTVEVKPFYIDRTEVSNRDFAQFVRSTGHPAPQHWNGDQPPQGAENIPVTFVNYLDASDFCAWRGKERKDGFTYRVPTEEEWEFAARGPDAGKPGRMWLYPWGEAWEEGRANTVESKLGLPQIVTSNPNGASGFGVLNMAGNVYEWTGTDFRHYPGSDQKTPRAKGYKGVYQVVRGGSFRYPKEYAMTTNRVWAKPTDKGEMLGFRCAAEGK